MDVTHAKTKHKKREPKQISNRKDFYVTHFQYLNKQLEHENQIKRNKNMIFCFETKNMIFCFKTKNGKIVLSWFPFFMVSKDKPKQTIAIDKKIFYQKAHNYPKTSIV